MIASTALNIPPFGPVRKVQVLVWICLSILLFLFLIWFPIGGFVAGIFTPLPSSLAVYQWGLPLGLVVPLGSLLGGALLLEIFGIAATLPYMALFLFMGSLIGFYGRLHRSIDASVFIPATLVFTVGAIVFWLKTRGIEGSVWDMMAQRVVKVVLTLAREHGEKSIEITPYLEEQIKNAANLMVRLLPGLSFASLLLAGTVNALATRRYILKRQLPLPNWKEANLWRSPEWFVWSVIVAGFLILMSSSRMVGLNILIASGIVYLFQGLSVILYFLTRWGLPPWAKAIILFFTLTQQYLVLAVAFLGLFDVWFDIRRIMETSKNKE
ncbi:MAG: YybS family protein [Syntrophobacterales bacterium]|nr:YybS family protein [Syntrophobacterales bacterium]